VGIAAGIGDLSQLHPAIPVFTNEDFFMCDLDRVSGFLLAAKLASLGLFIALGVIIVNSASFFAAAANVFVMIGVIAAGALATAMYGAAIAELDNCATGPCGDNLQSLRNALWALLGDMGVITGLLIGLLVVAHIPWVGAAAAGAVLGMALGISIALGALIEGNFPATVQTYNNCRAAEGVSTLWGAVLIFFSILVCLAAIWASGYGFFSGKIPLRVEA
jgi:hypothetical protein